MNKMVIKDKLESLILKPDGGKKKVILYAINELSFLKSGDKMLQKLKNNFKVFEESKDSIVVVLSIQTGTDEKLKLFCDDIIDKYRDIVHRYENSDFCLVADYSKIDSVYDMCDAYYGDSGMTSWRFTKMEKPVMIQNADI